MGYSTNVDDTDLPVVAERASMSAHVVIPFRRALWRTWSVACASRVVILVIGLFAMVSVGVEPRTRPPMTSENVLLDLPSRWDVGWYIGMASRGYRWDGTPDRFETVAFFPAWPALLRASASFVPHTSVAWAWVGVAVASLLFACGLAQLYRLVALHADEEHALAAIQFLAFYPFSIFFGLGYTEALFLLATVSAFLGATTGRLSSTLLWGILAGLTRPNGWLLVGPLLLLLYPYAKAWRSRPAVTAAVLGSGLGPVLGMLAYSTYVWSLTGDPFMWAKVQSSWGRELLSPLHLIRSEIEFVLNHGFYVLLTTRPYDVLNIGGGVLVLATLWPVTRAFGAASGLFVLLNAIPPIVIGGWPSLGRYTSVMFPVFMYLGCAVRAEHRPVLLAVFAGLQGLVAVLFFTFRPMF